MSHEHAEYFAQIKRDVEAMGEACEHASYGVHLLAAEFRKVGNSMRALRLSAVRRAEPEK